MRTFIDVCDRCGTQAEQTRERREDSANKDWAFFDVLVGGNILGPMVYGDYHLCPDCRLDFVEWHCAGDDPYLGPYDDVDAPLWAVSEERDSDE